MLQKIYILNKFCSFELSKKYKFKKKNVSSIFSTLIIIRKVT